LNFEQPGLEERLDDLQPDGALQILEAGNVIEAGALLRRNCELHHVVAASPVDDRQSGTLAAYRRRELTLQLAVGNEALQLPRIRVAPGRLGGLPEPQQGAGGSHVRRGLFG
jgi:hypothetical protein